MKAEGRDLVELEAFLSQKFDQLYERLKREEQTSATRWGGFFRRCWAFVVDIVVLSLLSLLFFYLGSVGYRVGLAAHQHSLSWENLAGLFDILLVAWIFLVSGYFVLLHGIEGRTVGKWLFGLRVVGARQEPISYVQALIRWIGLLLFAPLVVGFLRILWNREKRGWHDLLARTWVIRE